MYECNLSVVMLGIRVLAASGAFSRHLHVWSCSLPVCVLVLQLLLSGPHPDITMVKAKRHVEHVGSGQVEKGCVTCTVPTVANIPTHVHNPRALCHCFCNAGQDGEELPHVCGHLPHLAAASSRPADAA
jgi:hypothetical protein